MILPTILCVSSLFAATFADEYSVIIIGAGAAGVAAAAKLLEENVTNIIILEAESRIGGRVHSVFFGDAYVEMGAQWVQGRQYNIVYDLASPLVALKVADEETRLLYSSGAIDRAFSEELIEILFENLYSEPEEKNLTQYDFYLPRYERTVKEKYANQTDKLKVALSAKRLFRQYLESYEGSFDPRNVSAISDFVFEKNDSNYAWQGIGYKTIFDILIHKLPNANEALPLEEKLKLNEEVVKIRWNNENGGVLVETNNGNNYRGERVIFTPSLNVLKHDHAKLFVPELPENKIQAMQDVGLDAVIKIHLHFPERWWPSEEDGFNGYSLIWDEETLQEVKQTKLAWTLDIYCLIPADKNPKVLTGWITGPNVPKTELLTNEEITQGVEFVLQTFFDDNHYNFTAPDKILKSSWHNNPHFRGTYSYQTIRAQIKQPSPAVVLSKPLCNEAAKSVVCFAGEITHPHYYGTVHGAIETGRREANRIISEITNEL